MKQRVLRVLGKLIIHRLASESEENRDYSVATEFIDWSKQAVVGALKPGSGKDETHVNIIAELCTLVAVELITCGVCSSAPQVRNSRTFDYNNPLLRECKPRLSARFRS